MDGGRVVPRLNGDAFIEGNGRIVATRADGLGGAVQVLGNRVGLTDNASIDTSAVGAGARFWLVATHMEPTLQSPTPKWPTLMRILV